MHSAACFLNPSSCPGRTVICALTSNIAIGPPMGCDSTITGELQFFCLQIRRNVAVDVEGGAQRVVLDCGIVHGAARTNPHGTGHTARRELSEFLLSAIASRQRSW